MYTYCWNNPIRYVDFSGNAPVLPAALALYLAAVMSSPDLHYEMMFFSESMARGDYFSAFFDAVSIGIPVVSGGGRTASAIMKQIFPSIPDSVKAFKTLSNAERIADITSSAWVMPYKELKLYAEGLGLNV